LSRKNAANTFTRSQNRSCCAFFLHCNVRFLCLQNTRISLSRYGGVRRGRGARARAGPRGARRGPAPRSATSDRDGSPIPGPAAHPRDTPPAPTVIAFGGAELLCQIRSTKVKWLAHPRAYGRPHLSPATLHSTSRPSHPSNLSSSRSAATSPSRSFHHSTLTHGFAQAFLVHPICMPAISARCLSITGS
jgi:hypothetical protein